MYHLNERLSAAIFAACDDIESFICAKLSLEICPDDIRKVAPHSFPCRVSGCVEHLCCRSGKSKCITDYLSRLRSYKQRKWVGAYAISRSSPFLLFLFFSCQTNFKLPWLRSFIFKLSEWVYNADRKHTCIC